MNCFPCCGPKKSNSKREHGSTTPQEITSASKAPDMKKQRADEQIQGDPSNINAQNYTFRELATATKNFRQECLLGEGGYGRVYKGVIPATGQVVAVKQLDRHGTESSKEFLAEVSLLSHVHHENLVNLIGYCADGDQRLLVYEYFLSSTLEDRLLENKTDDPPLNWFDRMKVAAGASKGLEYLHDSANPPIIYRDLKASNILLDVNLNAKLFDFGMAKLSGGDKMNHAPPRVMGTYGYCAPEYTRTGQFSQKSDVYSFGVILLELITGRRAIDTTRPNEEQNLVSWAQPKFRDPKKYPDMADPLLNKQFPEKDLNQAVAIVAMCLQEEPEARPFIGDVVTALSFLSTVPTGPITPPSIQTATSVSKHSVVTESEYEDESESDIQSESNGEVTDHEENKETSQNHVASQNQKRHPSKKSSRKCSTRSRNGKVSKDSADKSASSSGKSSTKYQSFVGDISQESSSTKQSSDRELSQKSSRKKSTKELSQKSSRKSSKRDLSHKSSRKPSTRVLSRVESEDGSMISSHRTGSSSHYTSSGMSDSGSESVHSDIHSRTEESM